MNRIDWYFIIAIAVLMLIIPAIIVDTIIRDWWHNRKTKK
jgi:hypothetical protein